MNDHIGAGRIIGFNRDVMGEADFWEIMLASEPSWFVEEVIKPVLPLEMTEKKCVETEIIGKIYPKTTTVTKLNWDEKCILQRVDSCNSRVTHTQNWCKMTMHFENCASRTVQSGACKEDESIGKCDNIAIKGNIIKIDLFQGAWKSF